MFVESSRKKMTRKGVVVVFGWYIPPLSVRPENEKIALSMLLLGLLFLLVKLLEGKNLSIALHAQSKSEVHGWVAGSEITTRGLRNALIELPDVASVAILAPFAYSDLDRKYDLLVIEGYSGPLDQVIRAARRRNPAIVVMHWCLDAYPTFRSVALLPVDAFVTNSRLLASSGFEIAKTALLADEDLRHQVDDDHASFKIADEAAPRFFLGLGVDPVEIASSSNKVTPLVSYLGQPSPTKKLLTATLRAIKKAGFPLEIYGSAWDRDPLLKDLVDCCWKGKLESGAIADLYARSKVVLGTTEAAQRRLGMVNNRVYEALASGAQTFLAVEESLPQDPIFAELKNILDVQVVHSPKDAVLAVERAFREFSSSSENIQSRKSRIIEAHSYARRAENLLEIFSSVAEMPRRREVLLVVYDSKDTTDYPFLLGLIPALVSLETERFEIKLVDVKETRGTWCAGAAMVVARGTIDSPAVGAVKKLNAACARPSGSKGDRRRPPTTLLLPRNPLFAVNCAEFLVFDAVLYDDHFPSACHHPRATKALGLDFTMLREGGRGWHFIEEETSSSHNNMSDFSDPEDLGARFRRRGQQSGEVVVTKEGGDFELLAALVSGARVRTDDTDLGRLLHEVTSGEIPPSTFGVEALAKTLHDHIEAAFDAPRAAASVTLERPKDGDLLSCEITPDNLRRCQVNALVILEAFVTPDDGVWCLRANEVELACQGDTKLDLDATFLVSPGTVTLDIVLRAGLSSGHLDDLPLVRHSKPVVCRTTIVLERTA